MFAVTGTFGETKGKESKIGETLVAGIRDYTGEDILHVNGGKVDRLPVLAQAAAEHDIVLWMAHVPDNTLDKWVREIKKISKATVLVTSKRNLEGVYNAADIIHHALLCRSNLMIEIVPDERHAKRLTGRVIDPLGNLYGESGDFYRVGQTVGARLLDLKGFTRVESVRVGSAIPFPDIPDRGRFCEIIREHAEVFNALVPKPKEISRFIGNASFRFRCTKGFPAIRNEKDGLIYVTRRNISKSNLDGTGFVACDPGGDVVQYYGEDKPSVDTPIQLAFYSGMQDLKYCLHGHVYVTGAPFTKNITPCGSMEEVDEVMEAADREKANQAINLVGHGFIALGQDLEFLNELEFERRIPEDGYERAVWTPQESVKAVS